jgi:NAD(P)-dependent dehydrogenase (short-subunit alcohol dehydrogenase family)
MLLENKNAVIYGAGGAIGGATARAFARERARVFLTGHHMAALEAVRVTTSFREFLYGSRLAARYGHVSVLVVARGADQVGASRRTPSDTRQSG